MAKMPSPTMRRWALTAAAFVLVTGCLGGWIQANVQEWAKISGNDQYLVWFSGPAMARLADIAQTPQFMFVAAAVLGGAWIMWAEYFLRRWSAAYGQSGRAILWGKKADHKLASMTAVFVFGSLFAFSIIWAAFANRPISPPQPVPLSLRDPDKFYQVGQPVGTVVNVRGPDREGHIFPERIDYADNIDTSKEVEYRGWKLRWNSPGADQREGARGRMLHMPMLTIVAAPPPIPAVATPRPPLTSYETELKLRLIDKILGILTTDMEPTIARGPQFQTGAWNAFKDPKNNPNYRENLLLYLNALRDNAKTLDDLRDHNPQYQDIITITQQSYYNVVYPDVETFVSTYSRLATYLKEDASNDSFEYLMKSARDGFGVAIQQFTQWRNTTRSKLVELRREISP